MHLRSIKRCTLFTLLPFVAQCIAAGNIAKDACTGDAGTFVYFNDACYTHDLTVKVANDHMAQSCRTMNGLHGHLALPVSSAVMQSWSVFTDAHPNSFNYIGIKKMSNVSTTEDGWYFMRGTEKVHTLSLDATRNGDPPMLLPWVTSAVYGSQPDWSTELACGQVHGANYEPTPALWDNSCASLAGHAICEYSVAQNARTAVRMAADAARARTAFKAAAVTGRLPSVSHALDCMQRCAGAGAACRCASHSKEASECIMSAFPCDRADIFESSNGGDVVVFKRVLD